jgi:hypothetical protein
MKSKPDSRRQLQKLQTRADTALAFRAQCAALALNQAAAAKLFQVTPRTVHNWFSGRVRPPFVAVKLLRLMTRMELPGWDGWAFHGGKLWSPEGHAFEPKDGAWWSLLVRQARGFRQAYDEVCRLRIDLALARAADAAPEGRPAGARHGEAAATPGGPVTQPRSLKSETFSHSVKNPGPLAEQAQRASAPSSFATSAGSPRPERAAGGAARVGREGAALPLGSALGAARSALPNRRPLEHGHQEGSGALLAIGSEPDAIGQFTADQLDGHIRAAALKPNHVADLEHRRI